jgi:hypothetical protein
MSILRDVQGPDEDWPVESGPGIPFAELLEEKAWDLLGMTAEEFKRRWYAGDYANDIRPEVLTLDTLMRTGHLP